MHVWHNGAYNHVATKNNHNDHFKVEYDDFKNLNMLKIALKPLIVIQISVPINS